MAKSIRDLAEVLADSFMESGYDVTIDRVQGGDAVSIQGVGGLRVTEEGIVVDWEMRPGKIFGHLKKIGAEYVFQRPGSGTITPETIVYSAAAWWHDNEPFVHIVALDEKRVEDLIQESMVEEARRAVDAGEPEDDEEELTVDDYLNNINWGGVKRQTLGKLAISGEFEKAAIALIEDGVWYPD